MTVLDGRAIAVFCASREGSPADRALGQATGIAIANSGARLIYGAGQRGLMGAVREGALSAGGHVIGVLPEFMHAWGWGSPTVTETIITTSMHDRKAWMELNADAFIVLPGGLGTLDELITVMTTRQLHQHAKPIVLLDPNDYYAPFLHLLTHMIEHDFIHPEATPMPWQSTSPGDALERIAADLAEHASV